MSNLLIIGAGGHGKVVAEAAFESSLFKRIAFLDDAKVGQRIFNFDVIGDTTGAVNLINEFDQAFVAIGNNSVRVQLIHDLSRLGFIIPTIIHPRAVVSRSAVMGHGSCVFANAVVNTDAVIGEGCIINTSAVVEHDNRIGRGAHLSCNVSLGGTVHIGEFGMVGIGSTVINNISIGDYVVIGAGAVVTKDIPSDCTAVGVPARPIKFHKRD